jgi:hypothetical protein
MADLSNETVELLTYLESRGLSEQEVLAVRGMAIETLISEPIAAQRFVDSLRDHLTDRLEKQWSPHRRAAELE